MNEREMLEKFAAHENASTELRGEMDKMYADYLIELERTGRKFDSAIADMKAESKNGFAELKTTIAMRETWLVLTVLGVVGGFCALGFGGLAFLIHAGGVGLGS